MASKVFDCPECGIVEHTVTGSRRICTSCGVVNEGRPLRSCRFDECPRDATHLVVYNPVGRERRSEHYCERHAEQAAADARHDPDGDLFLGPKPIEGGRDE